MKVKFPRATTQQFFRQFLYNQKTQDKKKEKKKKRRKGCMHILKNHKDRTIVQNVEITRLFVILFWEETN